MMAGPNTVRMEHGMNVIARYWALKAYINGHSTLRSKSKFFALMPTMLLLASPSFAEGPDYFRLLENNEHDEITIHTEPEICSQSVGHIPAGANRLRNYGCVGGLDFDDWISATLTEREDARREIWCDIEHAGMRGWVRGIYLVEDN